MTKSPLILSFIAAAVLSGAKFVHAAVLEWDAVTTNADGSAITDLAGYRVFYRTSSLMALTTQQAMADTTVTKVTVAAPATSLNLSGFAPGTYFFRVTAYDTAGNQSGFNVNLSNVLVEVSTTIAAPPPPPPPAPSPTGSYSLWNNSAAPANAESTDTSPVELGVKFRSDAAGFVTGIRFYKGAQNGGTHIGNLWKTDGTKLASVTFANETASGWQQALFATPVPIAANTLYIASYFAPQSHWSYDLNYFTTNGRSSPPLHAPAKTETANGVFAYSATSTFPNSTYADTNYWVDVVFTTSTAAPPPPPPPAPAGGLAAHWRFDESAGTTAADASGNNNAGTLSNGPVWAAGKVGGALTFDGVDDQVNVPHAASLNPGAGSLTLAAWIKTSSAGNMVVFAKGQDLGGGSPKLNLHILGGRVEGRLYSSTVFLNLPASTRLVNDGAWRHIALVVDRAAQRADYYIDGTKEGINADISSVGSIDNANAVEIGRKLAVWPFSGQIDDLRLYTRALSASEIQSLAGTGTANAFDLNGDTVTNVADVQLGVNQAVGLSACASGDVNKDGACNVADVQLIVNRALGV